MAKLTLQDITGSYASVAKLNANFTAIEEALENTLSRDGTTPNQWEATMDANSNTIINLPNAIASTSPVTLGQLQNYVAEQSEGLIICLRETATATAGQTVFTFSGITYQPGINNLFVYRNGAKQRLVADYTETSSTSITFTTGLNLGDELEFISNAPTSTVSIDNLVATSKGVYTATGGETTLNIQSLTGRTYLPGSNNIRIYVNGLFLHPGDDFSETSSSTVTLTQALQAGDDVYILVNESQTNNTALATQVAITDTSSYYTSSEVEGALEEAAEFVQSGTGAITRTKLAKLREHVSVKDFGAVGDGVADDTAAITSAIAHAAANGLRVSGSGSFKVSSKIVINCAFDGSDMTFLVYGTPTVAVEVSTGNGTNPTDIFSLTTELGIILPSVRNMTKPTTGWAGQGIGVRYVNVQNMKITERLVQDFAIGVQHTSYTQGCGYNTVDGGYLRNNGVNRHATIGDASGAFTNRWDIYGGRYFHSSGEGTEVAGVIHVDIAAPAAGNILNDFNFFGASLEGNVQQYHARIGGTAINFFGCRWESSAPGGIKIHLAYGGIAGQGSCSVVMGRGVAEAQFNITQDVGASGRVSIHSSSNGGLIATPDPAYALKNTNSSADPVLVAYEATTDQFASAPLTEYAGFFGSQKIGGKRTADTADRIYLELQNGRVYFGSGSAASTQYLSRVGSAGIGVNGCGLSLVDGISTPGTVAGWATLYVDTADGDLKIRFGDGTIKTIVVDT